MQTVFMCGRVSDLGGADLVPTSNVGTRPVRFLPSTLPRQQEAPVTSEQEAPPGGPSCHQSPPYIARRACSCDRPDAVPLHFPQPVSKAWAPFMRLCLPQRYVKIISSALHEFSGSIYAIAFALSGFLR